MGARQGVQRRVLRALQAFLEWACRIIQCACPVLQQSRIVSGVIDARPRGGCFGQLRAARKVDAQLLSGRLLLQQIDPPGLQRVDPALDTVMPQAQPCDAKRGLPAVIAEGAHGGALPVFLAFVPIEQQGAERIVTVGEYVCLYRDLITEGALGGKASAIHTRSEILDDGAQATFPRQRGPVHRVGGIGRPGAVRWGSGAHSGIRNSTASGSSVSVREWYWPCEGRGMAATPPKLPWPLPP